ncbi:hypothetical protein AAFF_G00078490 [Aldrovandia affinis]|nr:hypothetical protein AAFF_G00078490 [Aldrovandia affinis]
MRSERNLTPNQLWEIGCATSLINPPDNIQGQYISELENPEMEHIGIHVPQPHCPMTEEEMETLHQLFDPLTPSLSFGADLYRAVVQYVDGVIGDRPETCQ